MNAPLYTPEILRLAASLNEPRTLKREDGRAEVRSKTCGSRVTMSVMMDPEGRILATSQVVHACAFGQASCALLEQGALGRSRDEIDSALRQLAEWLGGGEVEPDWPAILALAPARSRTSRHGAILLPFRALLEAMDRRG